MGSNPGESKNILFLWDSPFADGAGVGRVTEVLAAEFLRKGWQVAYLALCGGRRQTVHESVTQYFLPNDDKLGTLEHFQYVSQLFEEVRVDFVVNQAGTKIEVLHFLARLNNTPPILSVHHNCIAC